MIFWFCLLWSVGEKTRLCIASNVSLIWKDLGCGYNHLVPDCASVADMYSIFEIIAAASLAFLPWNFVQQGSENVVNHFCALTSNVHYTSVQFKWSWRHKTESVLEWLDSSNPVLVCFEKTPLQLNCDLRRLLLLHLLSFGMIVCCHCHFFPPQSLFDLGLWSQMLAEGCNLTETTALFLMFSVVQFC